MYDIDQLRRNVQVMDLLTRSFEAHSRGDLAACDRYAEQAIEIDADVVSVLRGGMLIGEVPRPEEDFLAWGLYVEAARDKFAAAEAIAANPDLSDVQDRHADLDPNADEAEPDEER